MVGNLVTRRQQEYVGATIGVIQVGGMTALQQIWKGTDSASTWGWLCIIRCFLHPL